MGDQALENTIARNETTLAELRDTGINALLSEGRSSTWSTMAHTTPDGKLSLTSVDAKTASSYTMTVDGKTKDNDGMLSVGAIGDFTFTKNQGGKTTVDQREFQMSSSNIDSLWGRDDKFTASMTKSENGFVTQTYKPATVETTDALDSNHQHVKITKPTDGVNVQAENIWNQGNHRTERDYLLHDSKLGNLSYIEVADDQYNGKSHRGVLRTPDGKVLGIVEQDFHVDKNGDLTDVHTTVRPPRAVKNP